MKKKLFSLILPTVGEVSLVEAFIKKMLLTSFDLRYIELIIINQEHENNYIYMDKLKKKYMQHVDIILINTTHKGLSNARNLGIDKAGGDILGFPDDDCEYFPNTLSTVYSILQNSDFTGTLGRVCDYEGNDVIRKWPKCKVRIRFYNFYLKINSVTLFVKHEDISKLQFDKRLGLGCHFGSNEDSDFVWHLIKNKKVFFCPEIVVYHPQKKVKDINKIRSYGRGFGGFCKKNISPIILGLYFSIIIFHSIRLLKALISVNKNEFTYRKVYITSRLQGFFSWKNIK